MNIYLIQCKDGKENPIKTCTKCKQEKQFSEFGYQKASKDGLKYECKECRRDRHHSKNGLITRIYDGQRSSSKDRGRPMPDYSKSELTDWLLSQPVFHRYFKYWGDSGYKTMLSPSCDRIDDYLPYSLENIRLTTWKENEYRGHSDRKNGINNKHSKAVLQFTREGILIDEYYSQHQACRDTGVANSSISNCCRGILKTAGGFVWCYGN